MASGWRLLVHSENINAIGRLTIPLRFNENQFGRASGFRLPSLLISREQFSIFVFQNSVTILDYSRNGTMVNGRIILCEDDDLFDGDIIQAGPFTFMLMRDQTTEIIERNQHDLILSKIN